MAAKDPVRRKEVAALAGAARGTNATPEEISSIGRSGAAAAHHPRVLARRIAKAWPTLSRAERAEVLATLAPILPRSR